MKTSEILEVIRGRRSVLRFRDSVISDEDVETILEAGRWAPSYINSQPWAFVVVRSEEMRRRITEILRRITVSWEGFAPAPVMIVVAVDTARDPRHHLEDGAAAAQNMALAAHGLGLSTAWAGISTSADKRGTPEAEIRRLLSIPSTYRLVAVLPVGYPAYAARGDRRDLSELVHQETFRQV